MRIEFRVEGRPPRKRGEKSMWARGDEAPQVATLRREALAARQRAGLADAIRARVNLEVRINVLEPQMERIGDLDTFITGVCDSLQAADPKVLPYLHEVLKRLEDDQLDRRRPILIANDNLIRRIVAEKVVLVEPRSAFYEVAVSTT